MNVLVVNAGSSSLKVALLDEHDHVVSAVEIDQWSGDGEGEALQRFVVNLPRVDAVGHRVVHGGAAFHGPVIVDGGVRERILALASLAPLHQPRAVAGIDALARMLPSTPAVACFDTAFHATLPPAASTYALPGEWNRRWALRRYGFHGLSHAYASRRAAEMVGRPPEDLRIVSCHLGAGASLAAIADGKAVDTTMGFTPLEGLVMATRAGSVDPGLLIWLLQAAGVELDELSDALEGRSGLAGLTGGSGDMRDVLEAAAKGDGTARLAFDVYVHRLCREIAGMTAALGGLDVLVFTGGVGEHAAPVRAAAAVRLAYLGIAIDAQSNQGARGDAEISATSARVRTLVVTAREDLEIARLTRAALRGAAG